MTAFATVTTEPSRDRYGRPLITPPDGGRPVPYTRTTTFIDCLDDRYNLEQWKMRQVAAGLADRPDLLLAVAAHRDDKNKLNRICGEAVEAAKATAAATTGTALHALTELVDARRRLPILPDDARASLDAYAAVMRQLGARVVASETFGVHDELKIAGTADRILEWATGDKFIADIKTGDITWSASKIAMQLALYARMDTYDAATGGRTPRDVNVRNGLIIHLPAGEARCDLHWVDLVTGWEGVQLAAEVRAWRRRKGFTVPFGGGA